MVTSQRLAWRVASWVRWRVWALAGWLPLSLGACADDDAATSVASVRASAASVGAAALGPPPSQPEAVVDAGRALFFDTNLSGRRDIACATCHAPALATTDAISLAIGTGGRGVGPNRVIPADRRLYPRNTLDLYNRGYDAFDEFGWDGRIRPRPDGGWTEPEDWEAATLPDGLASGLAGAVVDALSDRDRMTGRNGDLDVHGMPNELGGLEDEELPMLWGRIVERALAAGHGDRLRAAWGAGAPTIVDVANALAAYIAATFVANDTPFDRFMAGDDGALGGDALAGAALFFGDAGCADCHGGPHLTDFSYRNIGVPQVGLGQEDEEPMDYGRGRETNVPAERYAFRTPALRNVALTGPWMHDGAYTSLEAAVRHHADCEAALRGYDVRQLKPELQSLFRGSPTVLLRMLSTLDPGCVSARRLDAGDVRQLVAFLQALTSPTALTRVEPGP